MAQQFLFPRADQLLDRIGHDFRGSYRELGSLRQHIPNVPMIVLTATAVPRVKDDIVRNLGLRHPAIFQNSFDRQNLAITCNAKPVGGPTAPEKFDLYIDSVSLVAANGAERVLDNFEYWKSEPSGSASNAMVSHLRKKTTNSDPITSPKLLGHYTSELDRSDLIYQLQ